MLVILSQKVDSSSSYADELFKSYHYPARYKNQLHEGDIFIYCQGNQYDKSQRYYFGVGTVGEILTTDGENFYAKLLDCQRFERKVPIYHPNGGYIEQLGFETIRKKSNPPWQCSIRPLSQSAYDYIMNAAGIHYAPIVANHNSIDILKDQLKLAVKDYYVEGDSTAIHRIESIASAIGRRISDRETEEKRTTHDQQTDLTNCPQRLSCLFDYCKSMKMSYSYKPILILALFLFGDEKGCIAIDKAAAFFRRYYADRKAHGLPIEKKRCVYLKDDVTDQQIIKNLLDNPVKALLKSGYFIYNEESQIFSISPDVWGQMDNSSRSAIIKICYQKLREYYDN